MSVKSTKIETERYIIELEDYQEKHLLKFNVLSIEDGKYIVENATMSSEELIVECEDSTRESCKRIPCFWYDVKGAVKSAMRWSEYWEEQT